MLDTCKVLTCAATYQEFFKLEYLESSWLCILLGIIATHTLQLNWSIKKSTPRKRIWIFGDSSAAREGYDQHLGAHISQQGLDLFEISDNYKEEDKTICIKRAWKFITFKI